MIKRYFVVLALSFAMVMQCATLLPGMIEYPTSVSLLADQDLGTRVTQLSSWPSGWMFRKNHTIGGSAGAGINYQVKITTHYSVGNDSGEDVYLGGQCQSDFDDIRFTDDDGFTFLHHWREEMVVSDYAIFWVEISGNLNSTVVICLYYGNALCSSASSGDSTFIFFDDFESGVLSTAKWEDPGDWQIVETNVKHGSYAAYCVAMAPELTLWCNLTSKNLNYGFMLHVWARFGGLSGSAGYPELFRDSDGQQVYSVMVYNGQYCYDHVGSNPTPWPANSTISSNTYYRTELGIDFQNNKQRCWKSGNYMGEINLKDISGGSVSRIIYYGPASGYHSGEDVWLDDCYIRKWSPNEPLHEEWGPEEVNPGQPFDLDMPTLDNPDDLEVEAGIPGNEIMWAPEDTSPAGYEIYREGTKVRAGMWNSSAEKISVSVGGLGIGTHNFTLIVYDSCMRHATDTVMVTVLDTTAPLIDSPPDLECEGGAVDCSIDWNVSDACPDQYLITMNGSMWDSGDWDGHSISVGFDCMVLGTYEFRLQVKDTSGHVSSDLVVVTVVDTTPPTTNHPPDVFMNATDTGISITWIPYDLYPANYEIRLNGSVIASGLWNSSDEQMVVPLDGLSPGTYVYSITVTDLGGNLASDAVIVTIDRVPEWWELSGSFTIIITVGSLIVIVIFSALICRSRR